MKCRNRRRKDYYIAGQFGGAGSTRDVYYGRVLFFMDYTFEFEEEDVRAMLFVADWAKALQKNANGQVYSRETGSQLFRDVSVEDVNIITSSIGLFEHTNPQLGVRATFFIDPQRREQGLLERGRLSQDGHDMVIHGLG